MDYHGRWPSGAQTLRLPSAGATGSLPALRQVDLSRPRRARAHISRGGEAVGEAYAEDHDKGDFG